MKHVNPLPDNTVRHPMPGDYHPTSGAMLRPTADVLADVYSYILSWSRPSGTADVMEDGAE